MSSDTPRTDEAAIGCARLLRDPKSPTWTELVDSNFARTLERELTTKTAELEALRVELEACRVIVEAARNLCKVKGRHHTEIAMNRLMEAIQGSKPV